MFYLYRGSTIVAVLLSWPFSLALSPSTHLLPSTLAASVCLRCFDSSYSLRCGRDSSSCSPLPDIHTTFRHRIISIPMTIAVPRCLRDFKQHSIDTIHLNPRLSRRFRYRASFLNHHDCVPILVGRHNYTSPSCPHSTTITSRLYAPSISHTAIAFPFFTNAFTLLPPKLRAAFSVKGTMVSRKEVDPGRDRTDDALNGSYCFSEDCTAFRYLSVPPSAV